MLNSTWGSPMGSRSGPAASKSASVHLNSRISRVWPSRHWMLPSRRALGPPGRRLSSGSTTKGNGSKSTRMASMAFAAVVSSTAATASTGSPS